MHLTLCATNLLHIFNNMFIFMNLPIVYFQLYLFGFRVAKRTLSTESERVFTSNLFVASPVRGKGRLRREEARGRGQISRKTCRSTIVNAMIIHLLLLDLIVATLCKNIRLKRLYFPFVTVRSLPHSHVRRDVE